jgi:hypothetical protein
MAVDLTAVACRAQDGLFIAHCSLDGLRQRLPLHWPTPVGTPPSPKKAYRSQYLYLGWQDLNDSATWEHLGEFDLLLRLIDFSGLRPVLAQLLGWTSGRGWMPFDPVSFFLLTGWQITNAWSRTQTLKNLRAPRYADYAQRFGFRQACFPTEGGHRYFLTALGRHSTSDETVLVDQEQHIAVAVQRLNQLIAQSVGLIRQAGLTNKHAWEQALLCPDGMLHEAASTLRCHCVTETCYQPPSAGAARPCPAKDKERHGCDCHTAACAQICRHATPRDPQARLVYYSGSNQPHNPNQRTDKPEDDPPKGKAVYGYRSLPVQWADPELRFSLILLDDFLPANVREENPAAALLLQLSHYYPDLRPEAVAGDAGFGYELPLHIIYAHLQARRIVDLRAHATDRDKTHWLIRGYDHKGRPLCPYGYAFSANGYDRDRRCHKWICAHACRKGTAPLVQLPDACYPPQECPYLHPKHQHGKVLNVGEHFPDGSLRLVRDLPVGTPQWKRLYHQARNAVEGRNATRERWGLKRLPVYGDPRARAIIFQSDVWDNLTTLARLVREATAATGA